MALISAKRSFEIATKQLPFRLLRLSGRGDPCDTCAIRVYDTQHDHAGKRAYADLTRFVIIEAFINRGDYGTIENPFGLCEADAVPADVLLVFGVIKSKFWIIQILNVNTYLNYQVSDVKLSARWVGHPHHARSYQLAF